MKNLDRKALFESRALNGDLARKSVWGGMTTVTSQGVQFVLRSVSTMVLARLLTPADFGLIGMVTVITNFAVMFKNAGLSIATVQKEKISHEQISTLFWINVLISAGLGFCILLGSPLVARFYGKPELTAVTAVLSFSFIINGLTIQHQALQRRHMRFGALAIIKIASQTISMIVTIVLALLGWRYWALVGGSIALALANTLFTFIFCPWIPSLMKRGTGVREMLKFGGHLTGFNFINYFARNSDNALIGRFLGASALGLYSKAYNLFLLPISQIRGPINAVAMPALCQIRNDNERYRNYYQTIIFLIAALNMPLVGVMLVFADNIILVMLGDQWQGAIRVFQVLALVGFIQSTIQAGRGLPLMSMGFSRRYFRFGLIQSSVTVLGIVIGLHWGIVGVAAGYGIAFYLLIPFTLRWCLKGSPVSVVDWLKATFSPALATLFMVLCMLWIKGLVLQDANVFDLSISENVKVIVIGLSLGGAIYSVVVLSLPVGRKYIISVVKQFRRMVRNRKASIVS